MSRITNPFVGQLVWVVANGQACRRIYGGPSPLYNGHVMKVPGVAEGQNSYYVDHLFVFERKSDILALQLDAARKAYEQAAASVPLIEQDYLNALKAEQVADHAEVANQFA